MGLRASGSRGEERDLAMITSRSYASTDFKKRMMALQDGYGMFDGWVILNIKMSL